MKLSAAIRQGIALAPRQAFCWMFEDDDAACALGAAALAVGLPRDPGVIFQTDKHFPQLYDHVQCPRTKRFDVLGLVIQYMNDNLRWTREKIADWLEARGY